MGVIKVANSNVEMESRMGLKSVMMETGSVEMVVTKIANSNVEMESRMELKSVMMETESVEMGVTKTVESNVVESNVEIQSEMLEKNVKMVML